MSPRLSGPWSLEQIRDYLGEARIPARVASRNPGGFPLVVSLWFVHDEGALWCATQARSAVARFLGREPRCGFEVAGDRPPYRGVRGFGRASLVPERAELVLRRLIARYLPGDDSPLARWLLSRVDGEVALRIEPQRLVSWDYSDRM